MYQNKNESNVSFAVVDNWVENDVRFALYRLPDQAEINLVLQTSEKPSILQNLEELCLKRGFVIAPFHINESSPIVVISPDIVLKGLDPICDFLSHSHTFETPIRKKDDCKSFSETDLHESYKRLYFKFQSELDAGACDKLVLSRVKKYIRTTDFSVVDTFLKACVKYPNNFVFLCNTPETGCWLGSSPELLLGGQDHHWKTVALAGTKDTIIDSEWDLKNRFEQDVVVQYMQQQLEKAGCEYSYTEPFTVRSGNLMHLKTEFNFTLDQTQYNIGKLLQLLHPSPAVCGFPKDKAFEFILQNEGYDRSYYSGFLGILNLNGETDLYVNLRSMKIDDLFLNLYAGGGLVSSSEMETEWAETEKKLQTILSVID